MGGDVRIRSVPHALCVSMTSIMSLGFPGPTEGHWGSRQEPKLCLSSMSQVVADYCRQGYLDALRFLERRGR